MSRGRLALLGLLAVALAMAAYGWVRLARLGEAPLALAAPTTVEIAPGASVRSIARTLAAAGVIADAEDLVWTARLWSRAPLKAGEYEVLPGGTLRDLLRQLERGEVLLHAFTIVEGTTLRELRAALQREDALRQTLVGVSDRDLLAALGLPPGHPEGWFLPDTYRFPRGTSDAEFLRRAHAAAVRAVDAAWSTRAPGLPLASPAELLTLASVVEKETGVPSERAAIAGVFVRRLQKGMRLQTDPTVIYGLGARFDGNLRKQDLMTDTPYNTYTRRGLPPTPICVPGRAAIEAAAHPAAGDALYFVATGDGGHEFSATLEQHNAAVKRYLQRLRQQRRGAP
jgi:UPF0755 protein